MKEKRNSLSLAVSSLVFPAVGLCVMYIVITGISGNIFSEFSIILNPIYATILIMLLFLGCIFGPLDGIRALQSLQQAGNIFPQKRTIISVISLLGITFGIIEIGYIVYFVLK